MQSGGTAYKMASRGDIFMLAPMRSADHTFDLVYARSELKCCAS